MSRRCRLTSGSLRPVWPRTVSTTTWQMRMDPETTESRTRIWSVTGLPPVSLARVRSVIVGASVDNAALLRRHGVQVTAERLAVLPTVSDRPRTTAAKIAAVVRSEIRWRLAAGGVRRACGRQRQGHRPAHPARRVAGSLRGPSRREPTPSHPRPDGQCRLCSRRDIVPDSRGGLGLRDRRSRGDLLARRRDCVAAAAVSSAGSGARTAEHAE